MATLTELIPDLVEKTTLRKISWQVSSDGYVATLGSSIGLSLGRVRIKTRTGLVVSKLKLSLVDAQGNTVESVTDDSALDGLFDLARRNALQIDEKLSELKNILDSL